MAVRVLVASDWTVTVEERLIEGKKKRNRVKLALAASASTSYPSSGGIPLPTTMGMVRNIDYVIITQPITVTTVGEGGAVNQYLQYYNKNLHSIHLYEPLVSTADPSLGFREVPTTFIVSTVYGGTVVPVMYVEAVGW